jgi:DNA helicase-2/ATP-dependent DNA helicase PcrA
MNLADAANDPLLRDLNDRQLEAVTMSDESAIILAGAGSGKTSVLTRRAAYLIRENRMIDSELLMVTFTNKAAKEMKTRLSKMIDRPVGNMWIGTFHGLCHRMLRENYADAGLTSTFTIMDDDDQLAMCKRILKDITNAPEGIEAKDLKSFINMYKERGVRAGRMEAYTDFEDFAVPFYKAYETRCSREGVVDFGELLLRVSELLETNEEFLAKYRDRFTHIQVDEFQDTNAIQYSWLKALKGDRASIFAVGDDDQSIYAFRGSDPQNMQDFVHEVANDRVIRLEQNYRSTGAILDAANSLIEKNSDRLGKNLWTDAGEGKKVNVLSFKNDFDEQDHVARTIKGIINAGTDPSEVAILYRSNYQSRGYEKALMAQSVPYVIYGGTKFYERMEIKNALAYLRLTTNLNDDGAFMRVINFPTRGIGERTLEQVAEMAKVHEVETGEKLSLLEVAASKFNGHQKIIDKFDAFVGLLSDLHDAVSTKPLPEFMDYMLKTTGLTALYEAKDDEKEKERSNNLKEMITAATRFCEESDIPGAKTIPAIDLLNEFLATATLESATDNGKDANNVANVYNPNAVTLMTVHASKGLEFHSVFICGTDDGVFPLERSVEADGAEEERRLMYVAITRGKNQVFMTTRDEATIYGEKKDLEPSRFIAEIGEEFKTFDRPVSKRANTQNWNSGGKTWPKKPYDNKKSVQGSGFAKQSEIKTDTSDIAVNNKGGDDSPNKSASFKNFKIRRPGF